MFGRRPGVRALRQTEAGPNVSEICREMGVSQHAFYSRKRLPWIGVKRTAATARGESEAKTVVAELTDLTLDKHILQEVPVR
jgi:transposase-like protein